ncbi:NAD(P)H-binding protein [Streptomyces sp. PSKA54]|uniref:NAD(P)H-binding protein n=1 Tax=Streptomyces himalayensis subsp. aureolus TaxID=2758039 RepID=A0A7W2D3C2_9ACTN|nr:NAD(P)H-binding protein [Streptomyces himalayensis]MBA4863876.1 NAD(P)H-binding protein [Streptomyces himalayensis subsp. aureolus]
MILLTGTSGGLGTLIAQGLAGRDDVTLGSRAPAPGSPARPTRRVDFDDPSSLVEGFAGVDTLLMVSAGYGEDDVVIARHEAAVSAAERAGVEHVVYTSVSGSGDHLAYALPHRWTERRLRRSGLNWTILRNGLYAELLTGLAAPDADGVITAPLGEGRLAAVAREDLADAAVRVLADPAKHAGRVHELVGEEPLGGAELAAAVSGTYRPETLADARARIAATGAEPFQVPMLVGTYSAIAAGFMEETGSELRELLARAPRRAVDVYASGIRRQRG